MELTIALMLLLVGLVLAWIATVVFGTVLALIIDLINRSMLFRTIVVIIAIALALNILRLITG